MMWYLKFPSLYNFPGDYYYVWCLKLSSLCNIDVLSLLSAVILNNFDVLHNYCAFSDFKNSRIDSLFILFNRMLFSHPFYYIRFKIRFKIRFLVSFSDLHTFLPLVHVNLLWPSCPSLSPLHGDINFFAKFQRYTNFQKRKFTISITVSVLPFRWYIISFLGNSFENLFLFSWSHDFSRNLSLDHEFDQRFAFL